MIISPSALSATITWGVDLVAPKSPGGNDAVWTDFHVEWLNAPYKTYRIKPKAEFREPSKPGTLVNVDFVRPVKNGAIVNLTWTSESSFAENNKIKYYFTTKKEGNSQPETITPKLVSTPEPTSALSLLALGTLGAASALKRKQNQKSTEKETTKVG
jgi:hypothetical protein